MPKLKFISAQTGTPGSIYGQATNVCSNSSKTYSIAPAANTTQYNWTAPIGSIISGSTNNIMSTSNNSITITFPNIFITGQVSVNASNSCFTSTSKSLTIIQSPTGSSPGIITGSTNVCSIIGSSTNTTYSIAPVSGITNYTWTVPTNATLISGQGTTMINVQFNSIFSGGNITVASVGTCINSAYRALGVGKVPEAIGSVFGPSTTCAITSLTASYSVAPISDASGYLWSVPLNAIITSGNNTNNIIVAFSSSVIPNTKITVRATNSCGGSAIKTITITPCSSARFANEGNENKEYRDLNNTFSISELHPNPTAGTIEFEISSDNESEIEIHVFDLLGQLVYHIQTRSNEGKSKIEIDLSALSRAYYVVHIIDKTNNKLYVKRLIKK